MRWGAAACILQGRLWRQTRSSDLLLHSLLPTLRLAKSMPVRPKLGCYPPSPPQESLDLPNPRVGAAPALWLPSSEAPFRGPLWIFSIFSIRQRRRRGATPPTPKSWRIDRDRCDYSSLTTRVLLRICDNPIVSRSLALFSFLLSRLGMSR
ncbi:hypothetical protein HDV57DRAFT_55940 [Trichoderma longibrachiatum]